jgi:hypothetical protein
MAQLLNLTRHSGQFIQAIARWAELGTHANKARATLGMADDDVALGPKAVICRDVGSSEARSQSPKSRAKTRIELAGTVTTAEQGNPLIPGPSACKDPLLPETDGLTQFS